MIHAVFTLHPVRRNIPLPAPENVSSVALIAINHEGKILSTQHRDKGRGWDIPGGHVEKGETIIDTLHRETLEEAGAQFKEAFPIAFLTSNATQKKYQGKRMYLFATNTFTVLNTWHPSADIIGRALLSIDELMEGYRRDHDMMRRLISLARRRVKTNRS